MLIEAVDDLIPKAYNNHNISPCVNGSGELQELNISK